MIRTFTLNDRNFLYIVFALCILLSCKGNKEKAIKANEVAKKEVFETVLDPKNFDTIIDGKPVKLYWLENKDLKLAITNYGGRFVGLWVPDNQGEMTDLVVGMSSVKGFIEASEPYFGATIGRVGNRIAKGKFTLEGKEYSIPINNGENSLHGGVNGFQYVVWDAKQLDDRT